MAAFIIYNGRSHEWSGGAVLALILGVCVALPVAIGLTLRVLDARREGRPVHNWPVLPRWVTAGLLVLTSVLALAGWYGVAAALLFVAVLFGPLAFLRTGQPR